MLLPLSSRGPAPFLPPPGASPHRQPSSGATPLSSFRPQPLPFPPVALPPSSSSWSPASPPTPVLLPPGAPPPANSCTPFSRCPALLPISILFPPEVPPHRQSLSSFLLGPRPNAGLPPESRPTANPCLPSSRSPAPGQSLSSFLRSPAPACSCSSSWPPASPCPASSRKPGPPPIPVLLPPEPRRTAHPGALNPRAHRCVSRALGGQWYSPSPPRAPDGGPFRS